MLGESGGGGLPCRMAEGIGETAKGDVVSIKEAVGVWMP